MKTKVYSAFPGVGKTTYFNTTDKNVLDSDSSKFDKKHFPANYIEFDENQYDNRKKDEGGMQKGEQFSNPIVILKRRVNRIMDINS